MFEIKRSLPIICIYYFGKKLRVEIETERVYIQSYENKDFKNCVLLYGDHSVTKYFDYGKPRTRNEVKCLVSSKGCKYFNRGEPFGLFSLFCKKSGNFIGQADLFPTTEPGTVELGCILHKEYQNQGFGTEVTKVIIKDYIRELNIKCFTFNGSLIKKIIGTVHPNNIPSTKLIKKLGMKFNKFQERFENPRVWYSLEVEKR